ncbi:hypothetical protein [Mycolicibacterium tusciae]|uniref:hypothetical protein n=1 Tax=Mycolicibacterium tusciae TaxID=75922 RepID=UPI00024A325E|nr:hypothetical protein [Mycolicibacterium tusciae]
MNLSRRLRPNIKPTNDPDTRSMVQRRNAIPDTDRSVLAARMQPRNQGLLQTLTQVDVQVDQVAQANVMQWIREEYDERYGGMLIGMFSKCYLGPPFVDHKLDMLGSILEHYAPNDDPGYPYSKARGLARSGSYAFIEIYSDGQIVPILLDGTAVSM